MKHQRLRVALIGCGQIADAHLQEIRKIDFAEVVAVCDRQIDLAGQAAARFEVPGVFDDLERMLEDARPDVVHIATPPQSHRAIALRALERNLHVYIEKPFAMNSAEADDILRAARFQGRLVCVGHDQLFDPAWEECRRLVRRGELGRVVHVDSLQGYDLSGPFGRAFATEPEHWVHRLPGGLFQNVIPHALYRITDLLPDARPRVWATWFGGTPPTMTPTELRVLLQGAEVTGSLVFTSTARPVQRLTRVYGTRQSIEVDMEARVVRRYRPARLPGALARIEIPLRQMQEAARSSARNFGRFLRNDLHYFAGMNRLFQAFYKAIIEGGESPIPPEDIYRSTAIMDEIFHRCGDGAPEPADSYTFV